MIPIYQNINVTKDEEGTEKATVFSDSDNVYLTGNIENVFYVSNGIKVLSAFLHINFPCSHTMSHTPLSVVLMPNSEKRRAWSLSVRR